MANLPKLPNSFRKNWIENRTVHGQVRAQGTGTTWVLTPTDTPFMSLTWPVSVNVTLEMVLVGPQIHERRSALCTVQCDVTAD